MGAPRCLGVWGIARLWFCDGIAVCRRCIIATVANRIQARSGLIGWFDILGYRQMLVQNEAEDVVNILAETILCIPSEITERFTGTTQSADVGRIVAHIAGQLEWLPFSDTVLVTLDCSSALEPAERAERFIYFLHFCQSFFNGTFVRGTPMRGAVHFGDFLIGRIEGVSERVFAGRGIGEAEQESGKQDWSGCILTERAEDQKLAVVDSVQDKSWAGEFDKLLIRYPAPLKGGVLEQRLALNWLFPNFNRRRLRDGQTIRDMVTASFVMHGKTVTQGVASKLTNTELFVCFCRAENERRFPAGAA